MALKQYEWKNKQAQAKSKRIDFISLLVIIAGLAIIKFVNPIAGGALFFVSVVLELYSWSIQRKDKRSKEASKKKATRDII